MKHIKVFEEYKNDHKEPVKENLLPKPYKKVKCLECGEEICDNINYKIGHLYNKHNCKPSVGDYKAKQMLKEYFPIGVKEAYSATKHKTIFEEFDDSQLDHVVHLERDNSIQNCLGKIFLKSTNKYNNVATKFLILHALNRDFNGYVLFATLNDKKMIIFNIDKIYIDNDNSFKAKITQKSVSEIINLPSEIEFEQVDEDYEIKYSDIMVKLKTKETMV